MARLHKKWLWLFHLGFWALQISLSVTIYQVFFGNAYRALIITLINLVGHILLVYGHLEILIPKYFKQKKYLVYGVSLTVLLIFTAFLRIGIGWNFVRIVDWDVAHFFTPNMYIGILFGGLWVILLSIPLSLIEHWYQKADLEKELKTQQLEAELRFLKAQVNPHFLFNALNNIYSLSFTQSEKTPEMILKLSDMMSYMLYDCKEKTVPLNAEVSYLRNYIDLQQLKKDGEQHIEFITEGPLEGVRITPMFFIPFFENAFKHGNLDNIEEGWLKSKLSIGPDRTIHFTISNTIAPGRTKLQKGGVGLKNIQERLTLLYPDRHELIITEEPHLFSVDLKLQLP